MAGQLPWGIRHYFCRFLFINFRFSPGRGASYFRQIDRNMTYFDSFAVHVAVLLVRIYRKFLIEDIWVFMIFFLGRVKFGKGMFKGWSKVPSHPFIRRPSLLFDLFEVKRVNAAFCYSNVQHNYNTHIMSR